MLTACTLGSALVRIVADRPAYARGVVDALARQRDGSIDVPDGAPTIEIVIRESAAPGARAHAGVPPDGLCVRTLAGGTEIVTEAVTVRVAATRIVAEVAHGFSEQAVLVHLTVALYKALLYLGYLRLPAAAVEFHGGVDVFVGRRGAGKTSLSLALASTGATILGEDGVILRSAGEGFLVSGADGTLRVLPDTEAYFFPRPLEVAPQVFGGVAKKVLRTADWFAALPHVDHRVDRLFFPRVGEEPRIRRLTARETLVRLIDAIRDEHRFGDGQDSHAILAYLSAFARAVPAFALELGPRLAALGGVVERLAERRAVAAAPPRS
jgi:hypothetical protein